MSAIDSVSASVRTLVTGARSRLDSAAARLAKGSILDDGADPDSISPAQDLVEIEGTRRDVAVAARLTRADRATTGFLLDLLA